MTTEQQCSEALKRLRDWIARSAAQNIRRMVEGWQK
jgi:hypothetical protein